MGRCYWCPLLLMLPIVIGAAIALYLRFLMSTHELVRKASQRRK